MTEPPPVENQEKLLQEFADVPDESGRHEFLSRNSTLLRPNSKIDQERGASVSA